MPHPRWPALRALLVLLASTVAAPAMPPDPAREARRLQNEGKPEQAAELFKRLIDANPYSGQLYAGYGYCLHGLKRYDESIAALTKAIELGVAPAGQMYNIACAHALAGRKQEALNWLEKSFDAGFTETETVQNDSDMDSLRDDERFIRITGLNPPKGLSRDEQWRYDLDFFGRRMKQMHWDLYANVSEADFRDEIEQLKRDVPNLTDHQVALRLKRIVARVGDGHTSMPLRKPDEHTVLSLPVIFYQFTDGLHVRAADEAHKDLLGARVLKFGNLDAADAFERVKPYCSVDNAMGWLDGVPLLLSSPLILEAIGATDKPERAQLTLRLRDGTERTVTLDARRVTAGSHGNRSETESWPRAHELSGAPVPLYLQKHESTLWRHYLPERKLLYVFFGAVADPRDSTIERFASELFNSVETSDVQHVVLDMRTNGGGDTGLAVPLVHGLIACDKVNQPGKLFVITGRRTFSAAQNTVNMIETHTRATFVGEPTGSRPNFVGESTWFVLPYHGHRVYCSSRYWQFRVSTDKRVWVEPQLAAPLSFAQYMENRDPSMEAIEHAIDSGWPRSAPATAPTAPGAAMATEAR
jgi:tetratricopeptide (TPR) repeat protein